MSESKEEEIEHPGKATSSQPQEEFIEQKGQPSLPEKRSEEPSDDQ